MQQNPSVLFPEIQPEMAAIFDPIQQRVSERWSELAMDEIVACGQCRIKLCSHVRESINKLIEYKARVLSMNQQFIDDCKIIFSQQLLKELEPEERNVIRSALVDSRRPVIPEQVDSDEQLESSGESEEQEKVVEKRPAKKASRKTFGPSKPLPVAKPNLRPKKASTAFAPAVSREAMKEIRQEVAVVTNSISHRSNAAIFPVDPESASGKLFVSPLPKSKEPVSRESSSAPSKKRPNPSDDEVTGGDSSSPVTEQTYLEMMEQQTLDLLTNMGIGVVANELLFRKRNPVAFPDLSLPDATLLEPRHFTNIKKDSRIHEFISQGKPNFKDGDKGDLAKLYKLQKWFWIVEKCYVFAGFMRLVNLNNMHPDQEYDSITTLARSRGINGFPRYGIANMYAQIGEFILKYPRLQFQTHLTKIENGWGKYVLEKRNCIVPINERRLVSFMQTVFEKNRHVANQWK